MILCAGLGSRLRPLTEDCPKPLVPVGDRSVLAAICGQLAAAGHQSAVVNTHHAAEKFQAVLNCYEIPLTATHEPRILGGAGGLKAALPLLGAPVVVWNGDMLLEEPPLVALRQRLDSGAALCLAVARPTQSQIGTVGLGAKSRVVRLRGERFGIETHSADYVGLVGLAGECLGNLPDLGDLVGEVCLPRMRAGLPIETVEARGKWWDIGSPDRYAKANFDWLRQRGLDNWQHPQAQVAPTAALSGCVVGERATVRGSGRLEHVVVWPGASAQAPLRGAIVTPTHTVQIDRQTP